MSYFMKKIESWSFEKSNLTNEFNAYIHYKIHKNIFFGFLDMIFSFKF